MMNWGRHILAAMLAAMLVTACGGEGKDLSGSGNQGGSTESSTNTSTSTSTSTSTNADSSAEQIATANLSLVLKSCSNIADPTTCKVTNQLPASRPNLIEARLVDSHQAPIADAIIEANTDKGSIKTSRMLTDDTGIARFQLVADSSDSEGAGTITLNYTVGDDTVRTTKNFSYVPGVIVEVATANLSVILKSCQDIADPTSCTSTNRLSAQRPNLIEARLLDAGRAPITGAIVEASTDNGSIKTSRMLTDEEGVARFQLLADSPSSEGAGTVTLTFALDADEVRISSNFSFVPGLVTTPTAPPQLSLVLKSCTDIAVPASCSATNQLPAQRPNLIQAILLDGNQQPIDGAILEAGTNNGTIKTSRMLTNASGVAEFQLDAASATTEGAGTLTVTYSVSGNTLSTSKNFSFVPDTGTDPVASAHLNLVLKSCSDITVSSTCDDTNQLPAERPNLIEVTLRDGNQQPIDGAILVATTDKGTIKTNRIQTNASGVAKFQLDAASATAEGAGTLTVTYTVGSDTLSTSKNFSFVPAETAQLSLVLKSCTDITVPSTCVATNQLPAQRPNLIEATLLDGNQQPINGAILVANTDKGAIKTNNRMTDASGVATFQLDAASATADSAGTLTVIYSVGSDTLSTSKSFSFIPDTTSDPATITHLSLVLKSCADITAPATCVATNQLPAQRPNLIEATLLDGNQQPIDGAILLATTDNGTIKTNNKMTNASGVAEFQLDAASATTDSAGTLTITYNVGDDLLRISQNFTFVPDKTAQLSLVLKSCADITDPGTCIATNQLPAERPNLIEATLLDGNQQPIDGAILVASTDKGAIKASSMLTNASGVATFRLDAASATAEGAGTLTVTYSVSGNTLSTSKNFSFVPDATAQLSLVLKSCADITDPSTCVDSTQLPAERPNLVQANLLDGNHQPIDGAILVATTDNGTIKTGRKLTNASGMAEFQLDAPSAASDGAGTLTITYTVGYSSLTTSRNFSFIPGTATDPIATAHLALVLKSCTDIADPATCVDTNQVPAERPNLIEATLLDGNQQPMAGAILAASTDNGTIKTSRMLTDAAGVARFQLDAPAATTEGAGTLTVTYMLGSNTLNTAMNFSFVPDTSADPVATANLSLVLKSCADITDPSTCVDTNQLPAERPNRIEAVLRDGNQQPIADAILVASTDNGIIMTNNRLTDANGMATFQLDADSSTADAAGTLAITYSVGSNSLSTAKNFSFIPSTASTNDYQLNLAFMSCSDLSDRSTCAELTTVPMALPTERQTLIEVTLLDPLGQPVPAAIINATAEVGSIEPAANRLTNEEGKTSFLLTAALDNANKAGTFHVSSTVDGERVEASKNYQFGDSVLAIHLASDITDLPAGSTAELTANVTLNGGAYTAPLDVQFSSPCANNNQATLDANVTTVQGMAVATYKGFTEGYRCSGTDTVTATVKTAQTTQTAQVVITNLSEPVRSIASTTPSPEFIYIKHSGQGPQSSLITFTLRDSQGKPVSGQQLNFSFGSLTGSDQAYQDYTLTPASAITNQDGQASVNVTAGTIPVPLRVIASLNDNPEIRAASRQIGVGIGYPDDDSFSFAVDKSNIDGWSHDGEEAAITIRLADRFNNPVPDGTKVYFTTEGGSIKGNLDGSGNATGVCSSVAGVCTATLTAQSPRPLDGRVTVSSYVEGEESFTDLNGNGIFDKGELPGVDDSQQASDVPGYIKLYTDVGEAFLDTNVDDASGYITDIDRFFDFNANGTRDTGDNQYTGLVCTQDTIDRGFCRRSFVNLFRNKEFVFSGVSGSDGGKLVLQVFDDFQYVYNSDTAEYEIVEGTMTWRSDIPVDLRAGTKYVRFLPVHVPQDGSQNPIPASLGDPANFGDLESQVVLHGVNPIPAGSTFSVSNDNGIAAKAVGWSQGNCSANFASPYPSTIRPHFYCLRIEPESEPNKKVTGTLDVQVTSPNGDSITANVEVIDAG